MLDTELVPFPASDAIVSKIETRHHVSWKEVEEVFLSTPRIFNTLAEDQYGEPRYTAMGRTFGGRYVAVIYVPQAGGLAKVISAREMTSSERKRYRWK